MEEIDRIIEEKRREIRRIEEDIQVLQRTKGMLRKGPPKQQKKQRRRKKARLSIPDAAEQVLQKEGKPLHAKELAEKISALGVDTSAHNVATPLQRYIYKGRRFKKTAPATFALTG